MSAALCYRGPAANLPPWYSPPNPVRTTARRSSSSSASCTPEPGTGPREQEIRVRHCPFFDLAGERGEVIWSLRLGLMLGALAAGRAPVTVDALHRDMLPTIREAVHASRCHPGFLRRHDDLWWPAWLPVVGNLGGWDPSGRSTGAAGRGRPH
jgi:hypothetical protein